ncbi:pyrrolysine--tRNA(Pyl) ligase large subunit [Carboxydothermus ferrireducens]|uniref:Phenylalanyl-tRNA synthetase alpha chain n=1 Tax=Carboxydothermus ferrireducens DSM 11255 TaxID=1119529 RepID=A0ABX2RBE9_9THEO|nr:pyrrolysine--tRNA(Pyl) ligase large subunit [Carboxydothermus ferrireducens]NYE58506.1 phenylalanyl-tRNA synthetase alpha chain [Carboxydothermus ferrireducens DSM 11255]
MQTWSLSQKQRLIELNAPQELLNKTFTTVEERNKAFQVLEKKLVLEAKKHLSYIQKVTRQPEISIMEKKLDEVLTTHGFVKVITPTIISKEALIKMGIIESHPLFKQIFWIGENKCLRPMLAPNLYSMWRRLQRLWEKPIKIYEIGTCYRKESKGSKHLAEFTMLNVAVLGIALKERKRVFEEIVRLVMETFEIKDYRVVETTSEVYGSTFDVIKGFELASGAMGPHPLDAKWEIYDPWVGIGFGIERLILAKRGVYNIQSVGRSLTYLDGIRLNI